MCYICKKCGMCGNPDIDPSIKPRSLPKRCKKCLTIVSEDDEYCPKCHVRLPKGDGILLD